MWTLLKAQQPDVVPQVALLPAIRVENQPGNRLTGQDEAAAISHEHQPGFRLTGMDEAAAISHEHQQEASRQGPHLPRVPLSRAGIGKTTFLPPLVSLVCEQYTLWCFIPLELGKVI